MRARATDVLLGLAILHASLARGRDQQACEERGGRVVRVQNAAYGEWFCQERP